MKSYVKILERCAAPFLGAFVQERSDVDVLHALVDVAIAWNTGDGVYVVHVVQLSVAEVQLGHPRPLPPVAVNVHVDALGDGVVQQHPPLELLGLLDELANAGVVLLLIAVPAGDALDELLSAGVLVELESLNFLPVAGGPEADSLVNGGAAVLQLKLAPRVGEIGQVAPLRRRWWPVFGRHIATLWGRKERSLNHENDLHSDFRGAGGRPGLLPFPLQGFRLT